MRPMVLVVALTVTVGCLTRDVAGPGARPPAGYPPVEIAAAELRVLFVGNSLTYTNDLPAVAESLAKAAGLSFATATLAQPGWSLEEHWVAGVAAVIRDVRADVVVLQQGPSSLPESQAHLEEWTRRLAPVIREAGGEPALLMVWPEESRSAFFPDVRRSYASAAAAVDGVFIPGGQVWVEAMALDPSVDPWGPDRFHPSYDGTLAVAMTVLAVLTGTDAAAIPDLPDDAARPATVATLRAAVAAALDW